MANKVNNKFVRLFKLKNIVRMDYPYWLLESDSGVFFPFSELSSWKDMIDILKGVTNVDTVFHPCRVQPNAYKLRQYKLVCKVS